jgi:hypothetical protein
MPARSGSPRMEEESNFAHEAGAQLRAHVPHQGVMGNDAYEARGRETKRASGTGEETGHTPPT